MKKNPFSLLFGAIGTFLATIFGQFSWRSPVWVNQIRQQASRQPKLSAAISLGFLVFVFLTIWGYHWYQGRPRPLLVTAHITAPNITPVASVLVPDTLALDFGLEKKLEKGGFVPASVAPLKLIGKEVMQGITMTPAMPGKWVWNTDSRLVFTPTNDWPAGETYTIEFSKQAFAPESKMADYRYQFTTQPFQASVSEFKFYQDPVNPQQRQAVATINFNYPVDPTSLENKLVLTLQAHEVNYSINYDEHKRTAYLHSESLPLPAVDQFLQLTISKGVKTSLGSAKTMDKLTQTVLVPNASSYFKISNTTASIVRNDQDRAEQVLVIESTLGVTDAQLNKSLHVYLLPQDRPATTTDEIKKNYTWQNPGEITPEILRLSTPLELKAIPADRDFATLHSYKFNAPAPRFIYIKLDKGIQGFGDYVLTNDYAAVIPVPEYPKEISFLHKGALLALGAEEKLSVTVRGLSAVKFEIARVLPDDVNQLVTQTQGDFNNPSFINPSFNQNNISEVFSEVRQFDATDPAKPQYTALDLGKYLSTRTNADGPQGLFLLKASGWDTATKSVLDVQATRLILITDLGMLVKDNQDGSHDVFIQSITQGTPVANVQVSVLGKNGLPIMTSTTDATGHASFTTLKDFTDEREPIAYLAHYGNDVSFIPYNNADRQLNYSKFEIGGVFSNQELQTLSGYLFTERGIYRPGDTVHVGMIVKQAYAQPQPAGLPLEATVIDPKGATIQDQKFTLDPTGYLSLDFHTNATSPTGQYVVNLYIVKDNQASSLLGSTSVRIAEFQPDRMRITSQLSTLQNKGWISPAGLMGKVSLWNLYGAPAANRKISGKILLAPQRVKFDAYPNYVFVDPLFDPKKPPKTFTDTLTDTTTDEKGQASLDLNLGRFEKATYQLTFFAQGFEAEGGRSVTTQATALVSPLPYFIGYKSDGDLNYIKQNSQRTVNFIAINPELKQQALTNLKIQLQSQHPVTSLVKNPDGTYQYQSIIQTSVINTAPYSIDEKGVNYTLPTQQIGNFTVVILDQNNTTLSQFNYSVVGASQVALAKNAELTVKLDKSQYHAGDNIELQITAPYTGAGLITIERDKVYAYRWFKTDATNSVQSIKIPNDMQGDAYVNVAFIRDWNSPDIFISPLSFSVMPFAIDHDNHAIHIDLTTPALTMPGNPFTIQYKSDKPGKIIVFVVDEGILQVSNYPTPDPLGFFFQKRALEVLTQQTVDQILPKFIIGRELSAVGGDGNEAEALRKNLNPFKRKTDLPVVYWSGIMDVDTTPRQVVYNVPDYFNGTLRTMAVAVAIDAVGSAARTSEVRGYFVINPNVPTFVAPGDEFEITASIANNVKDSGANAKVAVQLQLTPGLELIGSDKQEVAINEGQEQTVRFKLRAKSVLGSSTIKLLASNGDKSSAMSSTVSVRPASAYVTTITSGNTNSAKQTLKLDRALYPEFRAVEAAVATSPLILVVGLERYLDNYPYGCTEQLVSKALPLLAMHNQPLFVANPTLLNDKVAATIQMLGQRQMSSGGFSYWPDVSENESNAFASVYAVHFLTEARDQGYNVPNEMLRASLGYLKDLVSQRVTSLEQARIQAYAIYVLTRNEIVTSNYLTNLQLYLNQDKTSAWKNDITSAYLAATYQLLKSYPEADKLINYYKPATESNKVSDFYDSHIGDAQYLYLIAHHFPDRLAATGQQLVMPIVTAINTDSINTVFAGYGSLALSAYAQANQTVAANLSVTKVLNDNQEMAIKPLESPYQKIALDNLVRAIVIQNPARADYFYQLTQAGFDKTIAKDALKQGLEVYREYRDAQGNVISKTGLGDEIEVHIQLRALSDDYLTNIAIVDLLPGGFEVVRDSVSSEGMDYVDAREDRVLFFLSVGSDAKSITYRIKATNTGKYVVPPVFAASMYNPSINARGVGSSMVVNGGAS